MVKGFQWFHFTVREKEPKLVYFLLIPRPRRSYDWTSSSWSRMLQDKDVRPFTDGVCLPVKAPPPPPRHSDYPWLYNSQRIFSRARILCFEYPPITRRTSCSTTNTAFPPTRSAPGGARRLDFLVPHGSISWLSKPAAPGRSCVAPHDAASETHCGNCVPPRAIHHARLLKAVQKGYYPRIVRSELSSHRPHLQQCPRSMVRQIQSWVRIIYTVTHGVQPVCR